MKDWMSRMEGRLDKLHGNIDAQAKNKDSGARKSNSAANPAANVPIESLIQDDFSRQKLWLAEKFSKLGSRITQESHEEEYSKLAAKLEAKPGAKPDSKASSNPDSQMGPIPEVLQRAMDVHHASKARTEVDEESVSGLPSSAFGSH